MGPIASPNNPPLVVHVPKSKGSNNQIPYASPIVRSFRFSEPLDRNAAFLHDRILVRPGSVVDNHHHQTAPPPPSSSSSSSNNVFTPEWLLRVCEQHAGLTGSPFSAAELAVSIVDILKKADDDIESNLFNLLGIEGLDLIQDILSGQTSIQLFPLEEVKRAGAVAKAVRDSSDTPRVPRTIQNRAKGVSVSVMRESDQFVEKQVRKEARRVHRRQTMIEAKDDEKDDQARNTSWLEAAGYDLDVAQAMREYQNDLSSETKTVSLLQAQFGEMAFETTTMASGLPSGAIKTVEKGFEKVVIPAIDQRSVISREEELVPISALDAFAQGVFKGMTHLNRLQSKLFQTAYYSNQNLLVCAPTGKIENERLERSSITIESRHRTRNNISVYIYR